MAAEKQGIDVSSSLFHVAPSIMEKLCRIMDCCDGDLGWRGLAEQLSTDWMEFRKIEKYAEQGKSRTRELLWSWAQKNKTVGDLLQVLERMGHERAIHLFTRQDSSSLPSQNNQFKEFTDVTSKVLETLESTSQVCCFSEDLPRLLRSRSPPLPSFYHDQSVPVENDESQDFAFSLPNRFNIDENFPKHPCECSQSEVTFLGSSGKAEVRV